MAKKMKVAIFVEPGRIALDEKLIPEVGSPTNPSRMFCHQSKSLCSGPP